jgi:uncharacterized membrane protein
MPSPVPQSRTPVLNGLAAALALGYPFLVYAAIDRVAPRYLALLPALAVLLRWPGGRELGRTARVLAVPGLLFLALVALADSAALLLAYPVFVSLLFFAVFFHGLRHPPTLVERLARLREPDLPPAGVRYTRRVTVAWCVFFLVNGTLAAATVWYGDPFVWSLFNGCISYVLMGLLMGTELLIRARVRKTFRA